MNNNNDFILLKRVKDFCFNIDNIVVNFPRKEYLIKERLLGDSLNILENIYFINADRDVKNRVSYRKGLISKINMLDFYIEYLYKKGIINKKVFDKTMKEIDDICRLIYGWLKYEC